MLVTLTSLLEYLDYWCKRRHTKRLLHPLSAKSRNSHGLSRWCDFRSEAYAYTLCLLAASATQPERRCEWKDFLGTRGG